MPLSVTSAVGITFACGSEVELISTKTAENTEWDWGCNDSNYETTAQDNAEQDAKTLVNDDLARQVALITCVSPCAKDVENPPRYNTDSKQQKTNAYLQLVLLNVGIREKQPLLVK